MARSGFLPISQLERLLQYVPPEVREIVLEIRNLVSAACPYATESVLWGGLSYHDPSKGGRVKGAICGLEFQRPPVRVSFIHGARLGDPCRLLQGRRLSKRYVEVSSYDQAPWDSIRDLIEEAASLDPDAFGPIRQNCDKESK
jgi:hypothetical protein